MQIVLMLVLLLVTGSVFYAAFAFFAYNRVQPAERACRDCAAPARVNGYELYYREVGADRGLAPVILVHGGPGDSSLSFKNSFDFLGEATRVIYYDQRGSGNSQAKAIPADYTIEQLVDELESLRREVVQAEKIILVGHSFGSALAQRYTLKYPERVEKLVLVSGIRINNGMTRPFLWKWLGPAMYSTALGLPPAGSHAADAWFTRSSEKDNLRRLYDRSKAALLENSSRLSFAPWREISFSLVGSGYQGDLRRLQTATLFIYGAADSPYTGKPVADEICALLPNCSARAFEHSGHWAFLEEPQRFQQVLKDFLGLKPESTGREI